MNNSSRGRLVPWLAALAAVLWTLAMALAYGLLVFSDDMASWITGLLGTSPEVTARVSDAGAWLEKWGAWLLGLTWGFGLVALLLLAWFANRLLAHFFGARSRKPA